VETSKVYKGYAIRKLFSGKGSSRPSRIEIFEHDLSKEALDIINRNPKGKLSIDTETGGLDFRTASLKLVQICTSDREVFLVKNPDKESSNLISLIKSSTDMPLFFHHAMFDLTFLFVYLEIPLEFLEMRTFYSRVFCTKTLMKIIHPELNSSLGASLKSILDVKIDKFIAHDSWGNKELSDQQLVYSINDTLYLEELFKNLYQDASLRCRNAYFTAMTAICLNCCLEIQGYTGLLSYPQENVTIALANREWWNKRSL
jgi:ribonuclease D